MNMSEVFESNMCSVSTVHYMNGKVHKITRVILCTLYEWITWPSITPRSRQIHSQVVCSPKQHLPWNLFPNLKFLPLLQTMDHILVLYLTLGPPKVTRKFFWCRTSASYAHFYDYLYFLRKWLLLYSKPFWSSYPQMFQLSKKSMHFTQLEQSVPLHSMCMLCTEIPTM